MYSACATFLLLGILNVSVSAAADDPKIHVLIVADTIDKGIGPGCREDVVHLQSVFAANVPKQQLAIQTIEGDSAAPIEVLTAISDMQIGTDDALVIYFTCHGAFDGKKTEQYLALPGGDLHRSRIRSAASRHSARFLAIIADACNKPMPPATFIRPELTRVPPEEISPLFDELFVRTAGLLEVSSTQPGQVASGPANGGVFTTAFCDIVDRHRRTEMRWKDLLRRVDGEVKQRYAGIKSVDQSVHIIAEPLADPGLRLGLRVATMRPGNDPTAPDGGVVVIDITKDSVATRVTIDGENVAIEKGDILIEINGQKIHTAEEFAKAVDASNQNMKFVLVNVRDGKEYTGKARLAF